MNEVDDCLNNKQSHHQEDTEVLLDKQGESVGENEVTEDPSWLDILPPYLIETGHENVTIGDKLKEEFNNNGDTRERNSIVKDLGGTKQAIEELNNGCVKAINHCKEDTKAFAEIEELHDKSNNGVVDEICDQEKVCDSDDEVDGNWIAREPRIAYDTVDTVACETVDADKTKDRTVCGKIKYLLGLLKASIVPLASVAIFAYDIGGDVELVINYKSIGELTYFWITLACIVLPSILMSIVDIVWIIMDKNVQSSRYRWQDICRIVIGSLSLGRLVRTFKCGIHTIQAIRKPHQKEHSKKADVLRLDEALLNFISAFTEDIIMLSVQLYLHFTGRVELAISAHSLAGSVLGIAWTYSSLYRDGRKARPKSNNVRIFGFLVFFIAALAALAAREIAILFFVIYVEHWISAVVLSVHFIGMFIWLWRQYSIEGRAAHCAKFVYLSFFAYVSVFNFINVKDGKAAKRMIVFYVILYLESFIMAGVAFSKIQQSKQDNDIVYYLLALPIGFVLHVTFTGFYYSCLHANDNACCKCDIDV